MREGLRIRDKSKEVRVYEQPQAESSGILFALTRHMPRNSMKPGPFLSLPRQYRHDTRTFALPTVVCVRVVAMHRGLQRGPRFVTLATLGVTSRIDAVRSTKKQTPLQYDHGIKPIHIIRLHYNPSRTAASSSASLALIFGTSCNLVSNPCFSSCMAKRFSASSFVLIISFSGFNEGRNQSKLTIHNPLDHRSVRSYGDISTTMAGGTR